MSDDNHSLPVIHDCAVYSTPKTISVLCFAVKTLLLLPLCLGVLFLGFRHRQRRPSRSQPSSHADFFAFHMALLELTGTLGTSLYVGGFYGRNGDVETAGFLLGSVNLPGELLILSLTCVDRYLAVVRPVTYLQLRNRNGVRVRNVIIAFVWLLSCAFMGLTYLYHPKLPTVSMICLFTVSLVVVSFCSAAVLRVLVRPAPGDGGKVDRSKRRAFRIVVIIMFVQLFWLSGLLVCTSAQKVKELARQEQCLIQSLVSWFNIPCSLVLPLLFLQKKRKKRDER